MNSMYAIASMNMICDLHIESIMTKAQTNIMNPYIGTHFVDIYSCIKYAI